MNATHGSQIARVLSLAASASLASSFPSSQPSNHTGYIPSTTFLPQHTAC